MLKILSQRQHHKQRGHSISKKRGKKGGEKNFGPLKHQTEQVYNQNIYHFVVVLQV